MKRLTTKLLTVPLLFATIGAGAARAVNSTGSAQPPMAATWLATPTNTGIVSPLVAELRPNIAAVARTLELRHKSLTTQVMFRPGVTVSKPVAITLEFSSAVSQYRAPVQTYNDRQGNRFVYTDLIGASSPLWGRPRPMAIKVTLTEGNSNYTIPLGANLDPLFDVSITPLRFTLNNDCDRWGKSEIRFEYRKPNGQVGKKNFSTSKGQTTTINEFAWAAQEVSGSGNLFWPDWHFYESDTLEGGVYVDGFGAPKSRLLPGPGGFVGRTIRSWHGQSCWADTKFDIVNTLRTYVSL